MKVRISPEGSKRLREMQEVNEAIDKCWHIAFLESAKKMLDDMANPPPPRRPDQPIIEDLVKGDSIKFGVRYQLGHRYDEEWVFCDLHCPKCGSNKTLEETGPGDYYDGPRRVCLDCGVYFYGYYYEPNDSEDKARLEALREKANFKLCPKCGTPMEMAGFAREDSWESDLFWVCENCAHREPYEEVS
jgi:predicted RNA-binding Zn-ribbon protein involved in translation (DUF1610 family)